MSLATPSSTQQQPAPGLDAPAQVSQGVRAVLQALIARSPYRSMLEPIAGEVERVALLNVQISTALAALASRPGFTPAGMLRRALPEERTVKAYLEYVAFTSPAFLGSVGEWPLGQQRG